METRRRSVVSWSSGKDCCWALMTARTQGADIVGLLTTFSESSGGVNHHGVPRALVSAQSEVLGIPLEVVMVPDDVAPKTYEFRMSAAVRALVGRGVTEIVFGDLFLEELRAYRERKLEGSGLCASFPLWRSPTNALAKEMLAAGVRATLVSVDLRRLSVDNLGREWNATFLESLPPDVDPCGENGEFHTFVSSAPGFREPIRTQLGDVLVDADHAHIEISPA